MKHMRNRSKSSGKIGKDSEQNEPFVFLQNIKPYDYR